MADISQEGLQIDHLCGNRACCNPDHLEAVTPAENSRRGKNAKLTHSTASEVRKYLDAGWSQYAVAIGFGVTQSTVSDVQRGVSWRDK